MASSIIKKVKSEGINTIQKTRENSAGTVSFTVDGRSAGIILISQNAKDSAIYAFTFSSSGSFKTTKIIGIEDVTISNSGYTVSITMNNWSNATIICNAPLS